MQQFLHTHFPSHTIELKILLNLLQRGKYYFDELAEIDWMPFSQAINTLSLSRWDEEIIEKFERIWKFLIYFPFHVHLQIEIIVRRRRHGLYKCEAISGNSEVYKLHSIKY